MEIRNIGQFGLTSTALGLGCMGMTHGYGAGDEAESIATIHHAIDRGITLFDTAEMYGPYTNEELLGKALRGRRHEVTIATKFGLTLAPGGVLGVDGSPANAKRAVEGSLRRLQVDVIDLYYLHRKDPDIPIEETVGGMKDLVTAGKVRFLGLSEVNAETLRRAHAVHPISAVQSEYSLWERGIEASILPAMRELGVGLVPFSPLGRGYLTGAYHTTSTFGENDFRRHLPRFSDEHMAANQRIVDAVRKVAARHAGATPAQVALAWVLAVAPDSVPIPGTKRRTYLDDNLGAFDLHLTNEDLATLDPLASQVSGERYTPGMARLTER